MLTVDDVDDRQDLEFDDPKSDTHVPLDSAPGAPSSSTSSGSSVPSEAEEKGNSPAKRESSFANMREPRDADAGKPRGGRGGGKRLPQAGRSVHVSNLAPGTRYACPDSSPLDFRTQLSIHPLP